MSAHTAVPQSLVQAIQLDYSESAAGRRARLSTGALLVILVVFAFLRDLRAGLVVAAVKREAAQALLTGNHEANLNVELIAEHRKSTNVAGRHRFRAIALVDNVPALMAWSMDEGYDVAMAEQLRNFVEPGDLVIGISGSGNSANVLQAMALAGQAGAQRLAFAGFDGGRLAQPEHSDVTIHVPSASMEQVEDAFSVICHCLLYALRRRIRQAPPSDNLLLASTVDAYWE